MVEAIAERGYEGASVASVCTRARISRRTFYEVFASFEDCFLAILDRGMEVMGGVMLAGFAGEEDWLDALLQAEAAVLCYLDSEPQFARVLLVDALGAGSWALLRRQDNVGALRDLIVERFKDTPLGGDFPPLAASSVMASLLGIMHEHLLRRDPAPMISLLGPLMGVIATPYLDSEGVQREVRRGAELAARIQAGDATARPVLPTPLRDARRDAACDGAGEELWSAANGASRARECLLFVAAQCDLGRHPSNREIAAGIGVAHQSQISRLLSYLAAQGLAVKQSEGAGKRNAWRLTPRGESLARELRRQSTYPTASPVCVRPVPVRADRPNAASDDRS
jgi:AcrR family transcriptional regulator